MPEICRFLGIVIKMFYGDHPPKHFHAEYNDYKALISLENLEIIEGQLPPNAYKLIKRWAKLHRQELLENWARAVVREELNKIEPLE